VIEALSPKKDLEDLQADLRAIQDLMRRHRLVEKLVDRQEMPKPGARPGGGRPPRLSSATTSYERQSSTNGASSSAA